MQGIAVSEVTTIVQSAVFWPWHSPTIVLQLICCSVDNKLFEISPDIRYSGVSSHYCLCGNQAAGSKPIGKLFPQSVNNGIRSFCTTKKVVNVANFLVMLCHIKKLLIVEVGFFWDMMYFALILFAITEWIVIFASR